MAEAQMIQAERIKPLNNRGIIAGNPYVLYWMQSAQRAECNHALEYAIRQANLLKKPLLVYFGVTEDFPEGNARHYRFMLEGLKETASVLKQRNIRLLVRRISPEKGALALSKSAIVTVTDRGYLKVERAWRDALAKGAACRTIQVETNALVPVETASGKEEYAAMALRPKVARLMDTYARPLEETAVHHPSLGLSLPYEAFNIEDTGAALKALNLDNTVTPSPLTGGTSQAKRLLETFISSKLAAYPDMKNVPGLEGSSALSSYLHFGQISPLAVLLAVKEAPEAAREAFLEELVVRRELGMNFALYNGAYDTFDCLPSWAKATLDRHRGDRRPYLYSLEELEGAGTHDGYWNAAQAEMALAGRMNGYMRMYWGKKILEWAKTPEEAFRRALYLNNRYSLDGRDPNSFAGVAWCFGKHDRPWKEREIFGTVRFMNARGLERKFDMKHYLEKVAALSARGGQGLPGARRNG
jgi:deoxyribodipyrimidine photo-lyase